MCSTAHNRGTVPKASIFLFVLGATATDLNIPHVAGIKTGLPILAVCLVMAIALYANSNNGRLPRPRLGPASWTYLVYLCVIFVSAFWSPSPADTIIQFLILSSVWVSTLLLSPAPPQLMLRYIVYLAIAASLLSLISVPISTTYAFQPESSTDRPELRGVFYHQLRLGQYLGAALAIIAVAHLNRDIKNLFRHPMSIAAAVVLLALVTYLAYARLYTLFTILALAMTWVYSKRKWARSAATLLLVAAVALLISFESQIESNLSEAGVDTTLTGRVRLWTVTLEAAAEKPWLGHGYGSFDNPIYDVMWGGVYRPAHPHNSYIQAFFENGYIGLFLIIALSLVHFFTAARPDEVEGKYSYTFLFIVMLILGSLTGANYASSLTSTFCFSLWLMTAKEARARKCLSTLEVQP